MSEEAKLYELLYLIPGSLSDQEIEPIAEHIRSLITQQQGALVREDKPMRRKLAYPIKQYSHGFYVLLYFKATPECITELNTTLVHTASLLRHVLIQTSHMTELAPQYSLTEQPTSKPIPQETKQPIAQAVKQETEPIEQKQEDEPLSLPTKPSEERPDETEKDDEQPTKKTKAPKRDKKSKISLDDLDEKLDEILTSDTL